MASSHLRLLAAAAVLGVAFAADCDCFLTNGTTPAYYSKHKFFDFRNLSDYAGVPDAIDDPSDAANAPASSKYFSSDEWTSVWALQNWTNNQGDSDDISLSNDATVLMVNSLSNVYIAKNKDDDAPSDTFMAMRTSRFRDFQSAAEFETQQNNYRFLSLRMLARTVGDAGAVTAMFTYRDSKDPAKVQEADIEILTRDPRDKVQYTNQPSDLPDVGEIKEATRNASMPTGVTWSDWAVYRLDWTPKRSVWFVNGEEVANIAFQVPRDASSINFNSWSDGGSWSGNMTVGGEAALQIQWIEMAYNTTASDAGNEGGHGNATAMALKRNLDGSWGTGRRAAEHLVRRDGGCAAVCSIDDVKEVGKPAKSDSSSSSSSSLRLGVGSKGLWAATGVVALSVGMAGIF